jgi:cysteinyl-tRNA synthetase
VSLRLYDSKAQALRAFEPRVAGEVGIYLCGPTVQGAPHVGHLRSALVYDQLRRWLLASDLHVTMVRNVTDVDDKIIDNAKSEPWWALAYRFEQEFNAAYRRLNILTPTYEPRATGHITEMVELIQLLIERGFAYKAEGSADVYFAASKWADYGELTHQKIEDMDDASETQSRGKRDPRDFALWKAAKPHEPESASWATPFGRGRPGWHIECSAMATRYLGTSFDIHGGGLDLRFPHHENELAQSRAAGHGFANFWLHNGLVNISGQKMSKSLGNSIFAADLFAGARPIVVRYYLGSAHYRSVLDFHDGVLDESAAAMGRIEGFVARAIGALGGAKADVSAVPQAFADAMNEDLAIPSALAVLHDTVRVGNASLDAGDNSAAQKALAEVLAMTEVLGINPTSPEWQAGGNPGTEQALAVLVDSLLAERLEARNNKDFARSDEIRDRFKAAGITLEDGPSGTNWSVN